MSNVLIVTADADLATEIGAQVEGPRAYALRPESETALRHHAHGTQPAVVVLDVRAGGSQFRALGEAPALMCTRSHPAVIVVSPWESEALTNEAARLGCFDVISLSRRCWRRSLRGALRDAQAAWLGGLLEIPAVDGEEATVVLH